MNVLPDKPPAYCQLVIHLLICIYVCLSAYGSEKGVTITDSLLATSNRLLDNYEHKAALDVLNQALESFSPQTDSLIMRSIYVNLGYTTYYLGRYEESISYYKEALAINLRKKELTKAVHNYKSIGLSYRQLNFLPAALEVYNQGLQLAKEIGYQAGIADINNSLGILYQQSEEPETALAYHRNSLAYWMNQSDSIRISVSYINMAICFENFDQLDSSLYYNFLALHLKRSTKPDPSALAGTVNNIGTIYLKLDEPEKAFPYLWEGYTLHLALEEPLGLAISYNNLSDYYIRKKEFVIAKAYLDSSNQLSDQLNSKKMVSHNLKLHLDLLEATGEYREALAIYKAWDLLKEENFQEEKVAVLKLGNFFLLREKEMENTKITQDAELGKLEGQLYFRTAVLLGSIGLVLLVLLLIYKRNLSIQKRHSLEINEKNEVIQMHQLELKHRTSNFLMRIQALIKEAARNVKDPLAKEELIRSGKILLTAASLERYLFKVEDENEVALVAYLKGLIEEHRKIIELEGKKIALRISSSEEFLIPVKSVINCGFIVTELINNSIKYAFNGISEAVIQINVDRSPIGIAIGIADNGTGMIPNSSGGVGTSLIERFTKDLKGSISMESRGGTKYLLSFPN